MTEFDKKKPIGDWGEAFFQRFRKNQLIQMGLVLKTCLMRMDYAHHEAEQHKGIDFIEKRETSDGKQYSYAYEIKTETEALNVGGSNTQKTIDINNILRPYTKIAQNALIQPHEYRGYKNFFIETRQETTPGYYEVLKNTQGKLTEMFPNYPPFNGRSLVFVDPREDDQGELDVFLFFIPEATLFDIVEEAIKSRRAEEKYVKLSGSWGYPVSITEFVKREYEEAFLTDAEAQVFSDALPFLKPFIDGKRIVIQGHFDGWKDGIELYHEHVNPELIMPQEKADEETAQGETWCDAWKRVTKAKAK